MGIHVQPPRAHPGTIVDAFLSLDLQLTAKPRTQKPSAAWRNSRSWNLQRPAQA